MNFTINSKTLKDSLAAISALPGAHAANTSSLSIRISADIEGVTLNRFSADAAIRLTIPGEVEEESGEVCVSYNALRNVTENIGSESISIQRNGTHLLINSGGTKGKVALTEDNSNGPIVKTPDAILEIDAAKLSETLSQTKIAISTNKLQNALCGVGMRMMDGRLSFIGTNGRHGHILTLKEEMEVDCVIPAECVEAILAALKSVQGNVVLGINENAAQLKSETLEAVFALAQDKLPNIAPALKPDKETHRLTVSVNRKELSETAMKCAACGLAAGDSKLISLNFRNGELEIVGDNQRDSEIRSTIPCNAKKAYEIILPASQLTDALGIMADGEDGMIELDIYEHALFVRQSDRIAFVCLSRIKPPAESASSTK